MRRLRDMGALSFDPVWKISFLLPLAFILLAETHAPAVGNQIDLPSAPALAATLAVQPLATKQTMTGHVQATALALAAPGATVMVVSSPKYLLPVPEVHHQKRPGSGYLKGSPLYEKQQATKAFGHNQAAITKSKLDIPPPLSTTMRCVINLVTQYFVVHIAVFVARTMHHFQICKCKTMFKSLGTVRETVFFVPMLCVLFLAVRLRAAELCGGSPETQGLPPWWVKSAMVACTWSVLALTVLVFFCAALYGDAWEASAKNPAFGLHGRILLGCRLFTLGIIYVGFSVVCLGICIMTPPSKLVPDDKQTDSTANVAVFCTVFLAVIYFGIYLVLALAQLVNEAAIFGPPQRFPAVARLLKSATMTVAFAPMLCALFVSVRLRANHLSLQQHDKEQPDLLLKVAFYICTFSVFAQTVLAVLGAQSKVHDVVSHARAHANVLTWNVSDFTLHTRQRAVVIDSMRFAAMACLYFGLVGVVAGSLWLLDRTCASGGAYSSLRQLECVAILSVLYFSVYLALWIVLETQREVTMVSTSPSRQFLETQAKEAVSVCPVISILFIGSLMRASQLTNGLSGPPPWCQKVQLVTTCFVVLNTFVRFDVLMAKPPAMLTVVCETLQLVTEAVIYASAAAVVVVLLTMTAEDASTRYPYNF